MKENKLLMGLITIMCFCVIFTSCNIFTLTNISYISNAADFTVFNETTGESVKNSSTNTLSINNGDVLKLVYEPSEDYTKYDWKVEFDIFGIKNETVSNSPYSCSFTVEDMEIGHYKINCNAVISDKKVEFSGGDFGMIKVQVIK